MIRFPCPKCGKALKAPTEYLGKHVKCTKCGLSLPVPAAGDAAPAHGPDAADEAPAVPGLPPVPAAPAALRPKNNLSRVLTWTVGGGLLASAIIFLVVYLLVPGELDRKLADLKSSDPQQSKPALDWLAAADPKPSQRPRVTAALEPLLFDGDVRGNLDPDLLLRVYLTWAGKDNVPAMIRMVQNPTLPAWSREKTGLVMEALGKLQDERAADALAEKLSDPKLHNHAVNALKVLGPGGEKVVLGYLFDEDPDTRLRAGRVLADFGTKQDSVVAEAVGRLRSGPADVRRSAVVWFIDNPPDDEAVKADAGPMLARLLEDLSPDVCRQALEALKNWATPDCLPQLLTYARREQKDAAGNPLLIDVLAQFHDERAAEAIALQLPNAHTHAKAAEALVNIGPVAAPAALAYLNHPDEAVRKEAKSVCRRLNVSDERQLEQTLADVADPRTGRARTALQHLAALRPDDTARAKVSAALNAPLLDSNADVRADALSAARVWGTTANTDALLKLLGDFQATGEGRDARMIDLLGSLKDPKAAPALAQGLTHPRERGPVGKALRAIGPGAEEAVIPFLRVDDREARLEACRILAEIGTDKSVQPLQTAFNAYAQFDGVFARESQVALEKIAARK
jgi:HEAT repeat protein